MKLEQTSIAEWRVGGEVVLVRDSLGLRFPVGNIVHLSSDEKIAGVAYFLLSQIDHMLRASPVGLGGEEIERFLCAVAYLAEAEEVIAQGSGGPES